MTTATPQTQPPLIALIDGNGAHSAGGERVRGLDTIRFVLACWVVMSHNGLFPLLAGADTSSRVGWLLKGLYGLSIDGPSAVITFFVISGFCIHYPYRNNRRLRLLPYYPRRYLRIFVPLGAAVWISRLVDADINSVLWSIVCEEIYYLIYPGLLALRRKYGWRVMLTAAFAASLGVAWTDPVAQNYWSYGWQLTWLLGLPCWLLGCLLAERSDAVFASISRRRIWAWRSLVWAASCLCCGLRFHSPIGYPHTLNLFAVLVFFWLEKEIVYFRRVPPPAPLERAGRWSYSLYLTHVPANAVYDLIPVPRCGFLLDWAFRFAWSLGCSYVFYLVAERPSHALARWVGKRAAGGAATPGRRPEGVKVEKTDILKVSN